ncbi:MAG TPA: glycosyltransferase, partial [Isosphaeraceae bacterium]|nr:glycosyltransferase [Isosphaeraceae bacterium]
MINGIPVIGSDRGGIPETLGDCGFLLPLPESLTPASRVPPAAEEVEPWVETIIRLWDDRALYEEQSIKAKKEAQRWHPDRLRPLYAEFFRNVRLQSRPPFVPRTEGEDRVPGVGRENGDGRPASSGTVGQGTWSIRQGANPHFPSQKIRGGQTVEPNLHPGLASIIVPCFNQREFTQLCLRALFRHSRPPWELIVVDNGSTDGTANYLAGVQDGSNIPVTVISNPHNLGFPRAINQGLEVARGEYLVLLNNDTVVTDGWLDQLIALSQVSVERAGEAGGGVPASAGPNTKIPPEGGTPAEGLATPIGGLQSGDERGQETCARHEVHATIGLVGPMSNYAAPPQLVEPVPYRDLAEMQDFARRWRDQHRGKWFTVPRLSGFCLLMKRAVFDTVGRLDERFSLGFFDDDDLALRARRAGFELAVAHDLFLHHFGSRTFAGNGIDAERLLEENARRFADKWGQATPRGHRIALRAWTPGNQPPMTRLDPDLNARLQLPDSTMSAHGANRPLPSGDRPGPRAKVTLVMIVRDEQDHLPRCLESVRGVFDEIVVVDTGSVDRTKAIAEEFGARVFDFVWIDDFSAARNAALAHATGDFVFWLDADDVLDPPEREKVTALLGRLRPGDGTAYVVRCACDPGADGSGGQTVVDQIRLFPRRDDVRWTYRVHEQILPALKRVGVPVQWTDLVVRHTGYTDPAVRARKLDRDARIALQELKERPEDPFILFNLGAIAVERQQWPAALSYLSRSLARSAPSDSITRKLFALIARVHQMIGDSRESLRVCAEGLALDPADAELWFRKAVVHRQRGESAEAEACWRRILGLSRPEQFASLDMGIYGHLTRRNLAVLAAERGDRAAAARLWNEVLAECPGDHEALSGLERLQCPRMRRPFPPSRPRPPASPVRVRSGRTTEP